MSFKNTHVLAALSIFTLIVFVVIEPSFTKLLHPDSHGYLDFHKSRTAFYPVFLSIIRNLGLGINQIPIIQISIFSLSLYYLLLTISRLINSRLFLIIYVLFLVGNIWIISYHKAILTESIYMSLSMAAMAALINFFLNGSIKYIWIFSFLIGISIGLRPSGVYMIALFPIILFSAINRFKEFKWSWVFAMIIPIVIMHIAEDTLYHRQHGNIERESILPIIVFAKGAMIENNKGFKFHGTHKKILEEYSNEVEIEWGKVRNFVDKIPYFWLKNQTIPNYEIYAQFNLLRDRRNYFSEQAGISSSNLMLELGKQRIFQDSGVNQWLTSGLSNYAASWGLRVTTFPSFVEEYNNWALSHGEIPLSSSIPYLPLKGDLKPSILSKIVFPTLLFTGILSGIIGLIFFTMLILRKKIPLLLMLSGIFSISVHGSLIFTSFINVATPRYTTTQYPILLLLLFLSTIWILTIRKNNQHKNIQN